MSASTANPAADLLTLARRSVEEGRTVAGRALVNALRAIGSCQDTIDELDVRLMVDEGRTDAAIELTGQAIARNPDNAQLLCLRAEIRMLAADPAGAAADAADALMAMPGDAAPKAALGTALLALGRVDDAIICLREAVRGNPAHVGYSLSLARALAERGQARAARETIEAIIALRPRALALRVAAIRIALGVDDLDGALALADAARHEGVADACILGLRGHTLSCLGREMDAVEAYRDALQLAPEDPYVRHLVASAGLVAPPRRASAEYVRVVFNGFASHFEDDLVRLDYRIPGLIRAALLAQAPWLAPSAPSPARSISAPLTPRILGPVLDLGCGTGLVALVLSDLDVGPFTGIDLSPGMLTEAANKGLYASLIEGDIYNDLEALGMFGLAIAADVLPYLGDPLPVLAVVAAHLRAGSLFVLTIEALAEGDSAAFRLGARGRYEHHPEKLCKAAQAAGFALRDCRSATLRRDRDRPVHGRVIVLERLAGNPG